jgi:hypothetical protein
MSNPKLARAALIVLAAGVPVRALAVSAEIAKKCERLAIQAYPPVEPGNPAAGSVNGTPQDKQAYFSKCLANDGKVEEGAAPPKK